MRQLSWSQLQKISPKNNDQITIPNDASGSFSPIKHFVVASLSSFHDIGEHCLDVNQHWSIFDVIANKYHAAGENYEVNVMYW